MTNVDAVVTYCMGAYTHTLLNATMSVVDALCALAECFLHLI